MHSFSLPFRPLVGCSLRSTYTPSCSAAHDSSYKFTRRLPVPGRLGEASNMLLGHAQRRCSTTARKLNGRCDYPIDECPPRRAADQGDWRCLETERFELWGYGAQRLCSLNPPNTLGLFLAER